MTAHQLEQAHADFDAIVAGRIVVVFDEDAPRGLAWAATVGPYDLGATVGHGSSREAAFNDLLVGLDRA